MLKIGLIGCGTMGRTHSKAYENIKNASVTIICDLDLSKAEKLASAHDAKVTNDYQELLDSDVDIIDICLPTYLHAKYSISAMSNGKNVFCEKPMAISVEEAKSMLEASEKYKVKLTVGHVLRFFPQYAHTIKEVTDKKIGIPKLIRTVRNQAFPNWSWENWYQDYAKSGGPILDLIIHDIDWIIANFGKIDRVYCQTVKNDEQVVRQDHVQSVLKLQNGAIAYVEGSWGLPKGSPFKMAYEVIGTEGQIEFDNTVNNSLKLQINDGNYKETNLLPFAQYEEPYYKEIQAFVNSVENNLEVLVKPQEALYALGIALSCIKSAENHNMVEINCGGEN